MQEEWETAEPLWIIQAHDEWWDLLKLYDPLSWTTETARLSLPKSGIINFQRHPFLVEPYRDIHEELVFLKGAQLGMSTLAIIRALWAATVYPINVVYTFPTSDDVSRFTATRINPLIASSEYLKSRILNTDSVRVKQFSRDPAVRRVGERRVFAAQVSTIYFNGAQTEKDATTVDADLLIHDEEDRSNPQVIEQYESRLDSSDYKWKIRLSTPTIPGAGIDKAYRATDQRVWLIRCPHCNHDFEMDFPANIVPDTIAEVEAGTPAQYVCDRCGGVIGNADRAGGRWVPMREGVDLAHGYSISQMAAPWIPAERILDRRDKATWEADFWNLVMGRAWTDAASELTREGILNRQDPWRAMEQVGSGTTMGIDVGQMLDVVVGVMDPVRMVPRTIYMGRHPTSSDELDALMRRFGVTTCVIDALPEESLSREFAERHRGLVWRAAYSSPHRGQTSEVVWHEDNRTVSIPRDEMLSKSALELVTTRILPKFDASPAWEAYIRHHENSKKVPVFVEGLEHERIVERYRWSEIGPDHMFHAACYEMVARMGQPSRTALPRKGLYSLSRDKGWKRGHPSEVAILNPQRRG